MVCSQNQGSQPEVDSMKADGNNLTPALVIGKEVNEMSNVIYLNITTPHMFFISSVISILNGILLFVGMSFTIFARTNMV